MSVGRPPTITLSVFLIIRSLFFLFQDDLDFLPMSGTVVVEREEVWLLQLEWEGSYFSDDRGASYFRGLASCRLLHVVLLKD